jgi:nitrate/TMAO reductase-like tetraheme cytochrome c subunit
VNREEVKNPHAEGTRAGSAGRRRLRWVLAAGGVLALVSAPVGWLVTDHYERDNGFCTACHLEPGVRLHIDVRRGFDAVPPVSLAGVHAAARVETRADPAFRCIDCHGGHSFVGRARVKALAAKDAFWYVVGHFEEPEGMRWPLWDEDCSKCHPRFAEQPAGAWRSPRFHQLAVHNVELGVGCVECHSSHETGGNAEAFFLRTVPVRAQCARCHAEFSDFEEGRG